MKPIKLNEYNDIIEKRLSPLLGKNNAVKEVSFFIQQINSSDKLSQTSSESRLSCLINSVNIGLTLNPAAKECYLIPRGGVCTMMPSYIGLQKLIQTLSGITQIIVEVVYKGDEIAKYEPTDVNEPIIFRPNPFGKRQQKDIIGVFALAVYSDGRKQVESMSLDDIQKIMGMSEAYKYYKSQEKKGTKVKCVWVDHFSEMCKKTVIKRIYKRLPRVGNKSDTVDEAIKIDNEDYTASDRQRHLIERLVNSSSLEEHEKVKIENDIFHFNSNDASECIDYLNEHQLSGIDHASSMKDLDAAIMHKVEMIRT